MAERIPNGTQVTWHGGNRLYNEQHAGTVLAFWPTGSIPKGGKEDGVPIPKSRIKFDLRATSHDRYMVEVPRGGKSTLSDYYAPLAKWLEK